VWDASPGPPSSLCLGESFGNIEDGADMPEDRAFKICRVVVDDPSPPRRVRVEETLARVGKLVVGARASGQDCSALVTDKAHVTQLSGAWSDRKLLHQWAVGAVLQLP